MSHSTEDADRRDFLRRMLGLSGMAAMTVISPSAFASTAVAVKGVRLSESGGKTRVIFDLSGPVHHSLFTLSHPDRVVIDFDNARATRALHLSPTPLLRDIRHAPRGHSDLRVVLDLKSDADASSTLIKAGGARHYQLVVDLSSVSVGKPQPVITAAQAQPHRPLRDVVVCIDPGHGGKDPGAIGKRGTYEKTVVLDIARRLEKLINREPGMQAFMTRDSDYFVTLRGRLAKARKRRADLFVSIHADASPYRYPKGSTVYVLSEHGASSEAARLLAERQNDVDRVAGVNLSNKDNLVASVLVDLAQSATREASFKLGDKLKGSIDRVIRMHSNTVERAAFVVLKSPDIPSALIETAFISNPAEERRLRTPRFRASMAGALLGGIKDYFEHHAPPGTILAERGRVLREFG
ncbi:N-acetylmuramoyl-L-alanine amidase [Acidihalobacter prosperus]|uniref:N-acetylmuramoyl-L-alanine amidase AmiC n=1 Tax=Acidihalobacter prosperus TaxID=160660 RepID=A0A1A6C2M5_9GAMM|nr:N-acetylmuramoyl-L-alanine amidase [Acidihalobacter prosperus]OBS08800.1 N-acetylmuramoyl-L-alanine amidase [Acidihalobacter prosperus]